MTIGCNPGTTAAFGCNALLVPGQDVNGGLHNVNQWLNPSAFHNPPAAITIGQTDLTPLGGAPTQAIGPGFQSPGLVAVQGVPFNGKNAGGVPG